MPVITPAYTALLALLFVGLSVRTLLLRREYGVAVGDANNQTLLRAMRVHANFAEYVPMGVLLLFFLEMQLQSSALIHLLCASLLAGRALHAWGVSRADEDFRFRVAGMGLTLTTVSVTSIYLLMLSFGRVGG